MSALFALHLALFGISLAQGPDLAPPPLKIVSKAEQQRLDQETDIKSRTKLVLELMTGRLATAERLHAAEDYAGVFRELGVFHGLMDNGIAYLHKRNTGNGKVLDNFKRLELALRAFVPRLETLRREIPLSHEDYVRKLLIYVREARTKATEPLFADTVIPNRRPGEP
ncbi:MAG TPA: hypothetical protein VNA17_02655 [Pyrinomonadaceae bacterium]|nr:hypothetical protein [Pyrinomonadaceae bacterium]